MSWIEKPFPFPSSRSTSVTTNMSPLLFVMSRSYVVNAGLKMEVLPF